MLTMLTLDVSKALGAHLAAKHGATVVTPDDAPAIAARAILAALARSVPALSALAAELEVRANRVSVTVPTPAGTVIILSPSAVADPLRYACTVAHEFQHDVQLDKGGAVRTAIDYVASPELRARAEADAYAVGLFVVWLLTGMLPTADDAVASLSSDTYHLAPDEVALGGGVLASHIATMTQGRCPPLTIAVDVLAWFRVEHPELIAVEALR
jgi:hypothetical protein